MNKRTKKKIAKRKAKQRELFSKALVEMANQYCHYLAELEITSRYLIPEHKKLFGLMPINNFTKGIPFAELEQGV